MYYRIHKVKRLKARLKVIICSENHYLQMFIIIHFRFIQILLKRQIKNYVFHLFASFMIII